MKSRWCVIGALLLLQGCASKYIPYHSDASIPFYSKTTKSLLTYIGGNREFEGKRKYAVYSAIDSADVYYLLIVPQESGMSSSPLKGGKSSSNLLQRYPLAFAVTVKPAHASELIQIVDASIALWDAKYDRTNSLFYEYMVAPEQEIKKVSENVTQWNPTMKYAFQNSAEGPVAAIIFGEGLLKFQCDLKNLDDLKDFRDVLVAGVKDLESKGMPSD